MTLLLLWFSIYAILFQANGERERRGENNTQLNNCPFLLREILPVLLENFYCDDLVVSTSQAITIERNLFDLVFVITG